jgi:hypothetical protein
MFYTLSCNNYIIHDISQLHNVIMYSKTSLQHNPILVCMVLYVLHQDATGNNLASDTPS